MYLEKIKSNGHVYIYLMQYAVRKNYVNNKKYVYRFGRADRARQKMKHWADNLHKLPVELIEKGITKNDLEHWMKDIEKFA